MSKPAEKFRIFVSSTTRDLKVHREQVRDLITAMGFVDIAMENWSADARPTVDVITKALNESDVYVGIFGFLYGERLRRGGISFTEFEYRVARKRGIPTLLYLLDPEHLVKYLEINCTFALINCTFALIRWLHRRHALRAQALLRGLSSGSRGNLFQAFLRFGAPEVFRESSHLFEEMTVSWCRIDQSMIPDEFVFRRVRLSITSPSGSRSRQRS